MRRLAARLVGMLRKSSRQFSLSPALSHRMGEGEAADAFEEFQKPFTHARPVPSPLGGERVRGRAAKLDGLDKAGPFAIGNSITAVFIVCTFRNRPLPVCQKFPTKPLPPPASRNPGFQPRSGLTVPVCRRTLLP